MNNNIIITEEFKEHIKIAKLLLEQNSEVSKAAQICIECLANDGKILLFGNGGSASDAQHIAAEIVGRFSANRKGLAAIALSSDTSVITSIGNDFGYNEIFRRQVEALAKKDDVIIAISTSGNSENVLNGIKIANKLKCKTIGLTGNNGGSMNMLCDTIIDVPSKVTARIQEMHILLGHVICNLIDLKFKD